MTKGSEKKGQLDFAEQFSEAFERLILKMKDIDDWCVQVTRDISHQELSLLCYIGKQNGLIMRDIANYLNVPFSTATGIVEKLVQKNYTHRTHSEDDRRAIIIKLTDMGQKTFELVENKKGEMGKSMATTITEAEQKEMLRIINKIISGL